MGLWSLLSGWKTKSLGRGEKRLAEERRRRDRSRRCRFESMEERRLLDADPIKLGVTYLEEDSGSDLHGDTFEVLFEGGAAGTELTELTIDGDQGAAGLTVGDMIFDTIKGGLGADEAFNLQIVSSTGIGNVSWQVSDGGTKLTFQFQGFNVGEKLVFTVDVDEIQDYDPAETDLKTINESIDPVASGVEFQGSHATGKFSAPGFYDVQGTKDFRNVYDAQFVGTNLLISQGNANGLPHDDHLGKRDRSTGVMLPLQQEPLPITIGGKVFVDHNRNLVQEAGDQNLSGVTLALWKKVGGQWTNTGFTRQTDAQGNYLFGLDLDLKPGVYEVREAQPAGYTSVGAIPGNVSGTSTGSTVQGNPDVLTEINIPLGGTHGVKYDFAEALPASIRGRVHLTDREGNCFSEEALNRPLEGVKVTLKDANGNILAVDFTNQNGEYEFLDLLPGTYTIVEETPLGLLDGGDHLGTINGVVVGQKPANDTLSNIVLAGGEHGINYDFCEKEPALISGYVYYDPNDNGLKEAGEAPIPGATVILLDAGGTQIAQTTTDATGFYKFTNLSAGTYSIREIQPTGYLDGKDTAGTIAGVVVGTALNDRINTIPILYGDEGINYNFGELKPGSIAGRVWHDPDGDCLFDSDEDPIPGTVVQLLDAGGNVIATQTTDENGEYLFDNLAPGVYGVREIQPAGYLQGGTMAGSKGGDDSIQDSITGAVIGSDEHLVEYNFCEQLPVSISGEVWVDLNSNCVHDAGETNIPGVVIHLLNANGDVIAVTQTDANGQYKFDGLAPGTYAVRELQPVEYFDHCEQAGSHGGDDSQDDLITQIVLKSGDNAVHYDFSEIPPALLSGYIFRDGPAIFTADGKVPVNLYDLRDGILTADDLRLAGVVVELRFTLTGELVTDADVLPGTYPPGPLRTTTNANGYYEFRGLPAGNYTVLEAQPSGYFDSRDTPGSTTGLAVNLNNFVNPLFIQTFAMQGVSFKNDAILQIPLAAGQHSQVNNFSEVQVFQMELPPPPPELPPPPVVPPRPFLQPTLPIIPPQIFVAPPPPPIVTGGSSSWTWHLSVIDAGLPRVARRSTRMGDVAAWRPAMYVERTEWQPESLRQGIWTIHSSGDDAGNPPQPHLVFGIPDSIPVTGDWNGDGKTEIGIYYKGEWFLDLNGNGRWDAEDLWAKLGSEADRPVTGDWDGDGKDDIGIFGPEWPGDPRHLEFEPGLPDSDNILLKRPKNPPPNPDQATDGERLLRLTSTGKERADLIDHVFRFGGPSDVPIAGDWNGDGIRSVGVFRNGKWHFDLDGDGRWSEGDKTAHFGQAGDVPVVGDFNGDGIEEIGIFRNGQWVIDTNGNRQIDAADKVIELGGAGDKPVVGDWDGDGTDEPGLYREGTVGKDE